MAGALVTRHLRHLIRTSDGGRVCARPITTGLYWLYQQDIHGPAPENATHIEPGTGEPITGVRGSDAVAFAHWVNAITGSETVYRLPSLAEIEDFAVQRALTTSTAETPTRSIWLELDSGHGQPELWTPAATDHPHRIDAATLARHTNDDIKRSTPTLTRLLLLRSITTALDLDLDLGLDRDLDLDFNRARALGLGLALDLNLDRARVLDCALGLGFGLDLGRARARVLDHARGVDHALNLDHGLGFAFDLGRVLPHARVLDHVMGSALSHALTRILRQGTATSTWSVGFSHALVEETGVARATYVVSLDTLADMILAGRGALMELLGPRDEAAPPLPRPHGPTGS